MLCGSFSQHKKYQEDSRTAFVNLKFFKQSTKALHYYVETHLKSKQVYFVRKQHCASCLSDEFYLYSPKRKGSSI